jgi:hypothetical protein
VAILLCVTATAYESPDHCCPAASSNSQVVAKPPISLGRSP